MTNYSQRYAADDSNTAGAFYFDTIAAVDYPASKVLWGAAGAVNHASAADPLPVTSVITGDALTALQLLDNAVSGAGFNITQLNGAAVPIGAGVEATALRVTLATDSTGVLSVDDNGGSLTVDGTFWQATQPVSIAATVTVTGAGGTFPITDSGGSITVDNPALSVTGGGVEASALRVTLASDSTGLLSVDDNGGSLTVDGTVAFSNTTLAVTNVGTFAVQSTLQAGTAYAGKVRLTDGTTDAEVVPLAGYNAQAVAIVDGSGNQITSFGGGTQYTEDAAAAADPVGTAPILIRKDTPATVTSTDGDNIAQRGTNYGAAYVQLVTSSGAYIDSVGGGTQYTEADTDASITGTAVMWEDTGDTLRVVSATKPLPIGDAGGSLTVDGSLTTVSTVTSLSQFAGQAITLGAGSVAAGTLRTTLAADDPAVASLATLVAVDYMLGTDFSTVFGAASLVIATQADNVANTQDTVATSALGYVFDGTTWDRQRGDATDGTLVNLGTNNDVTVTSGNIIVDSITGTVTVGTHAVTQSGTWNITNVSGTVSLPTGASTAAKQPALGTAGTASADVITVQGIASMTALKVDGSAVTQPVSGTVAVSGTVTVGSHAVTNAGTFAVQVDGAALTALQLLDNIVSGSGVNVSQINGVAPTMGNGASGTGVQRVTIANDSTGILAGVTTVTTVTTCSTLTTLTGGGVAHDAADSGNPIKVGAKATASLAGATMVAAADRSDLICGTDGALIVRPGYSLEDVVQERTTNTDGAATAFASGLAAPGSGVRLWITSVTIANSSATFCTVDLRDGAAGAVLWTVPVPATGGATLRFDPPLKLTANTALAFDASAAISTLSISANGFKSKV
jgi:hypothetical protein